MINFILMLITIILSPVLIICGVMSFILILGVIIGIVAMIVGGISELIEYVKNE